ncbi:MAG: SLBB domain-containing protein [Gemmatimonadota bacterium]|nr:SLBB domain-containing protein [Gemmatimonadota bacterium]
MTRRRLPVLLFLALPVFAAGAAAARAQQIPPGAEQVLRNMSPQEIQRRLLESGLTEAQIRDRLRRAGYDPSLADRYFGSEMGAAEMQGAPEDAEFLNALRSVGVSLRLSSDTLQARMGLPTFAEEGLDSLAAEDADPLALPVFGSDVFRRYTTQFDPVLTGPVGSGYRLGPGDELVLVVTGDVELAYRLDVTREGYVIIPDVGQVFVNGLDVGQLEGRLANRLGQVYSGLRRSPPTTHFDISLGRLRTNQVYVVGEVERPGAYQVSSVATLLEGLYAAGGPRDAGSYRQVVLRRGDRVVGTFDLYRYLTAGETPHDLRLEEGDVVFVPPVGAQVAVRGEVQREAWFEVVEGEDLSTLVTFAGGVRAGARTDRIQVDRILPVGVRSAGQDRVILDVDLDAVRSGARAFPMEGGDEVRVFPLLEERRGWVGIDGAVYHPGTYQLRPGATVGSLVEWAGGTTPDVLEPAVHVSRLDRTNGVRSLIRAELPAGLAVPLQEFDEVTLFGRDSLLTPDSVAVFGFVQNPGRYPLSHGATAEDVILLAGGFAQGADPRRAEVVRTESVAGDGRSIGKSTVVALSESIPRVTADLLGTLPPLADSLAWSGDVTLRRGDEVYVRMFPGYREPQRVTVSGEVVSPGTFVLERMDERLSTVLRRAGGLTPEAFPEGVRLVRDGIIVGMNAEEALADPGGVEDPVLMAGDRVVVPVYDGTVLVRGAVAFDTRVVYRRGMGLGDVLAQAGGATPDADQGRISVEYANGQRATVTRWMGITWSRPAIRPGSAVFVPAKQEGGGTNWDAVFTKVVTLTSVVATVAIAFR